MSASTVDRGPVSRRSSRARERRQVVTERGVANRAPVVLGDPVEGDGDRHGYTRSPKLRSSRSNRRVGSDEQHERDGESTRGDDGIGPVALGDDVAEAVDGARNGIGDAVDGLPRLVKQAQGPDDRADKQPHLEQERQCVPHVAVVDVQRPEDEPHRGGGRDQHHDQNRQGHPRQGRPLAEQRRHHEQHPERGGEVDQRRTDRAERNGLAREVDLAQQHLVRDEALGRRRGRRVDVRPARHARQREQQVWRLASRRNAREPTEYEREDKRGKHGLDERPAHANHGLLVLHLHRAHREGPQHLAVVPQLLEVGAGEAAPFGRDLDQRLGHRGLVGLRYGRGPGQAHRWSAAQRPS